MRASAWRKEGDDAHSALRLKLYVLGEVLPLSASLPVFENLGLKVIAEDAYPGLASSATMAGAEDSAILDFLMERADGHAGAAGRYPRSRWKTCSMPCCAAQAESDGFNRLVIGRGAGLARRGDPARGGEIPAPGRHSLQPGLYGAGAGPQSRHRGPAGRAVPCPAAIRNRSQRVRTPRNCRRRIEAALRDVPSLDDDRIIRRFRNVIENILRTNY